MNTKKFVFTSFVILSVIAIIITSLFDHATGLGHPQYDADYDQVDVFYDIIKDSRIYPGAHTWYKGFFIIDFVWPILLILVIGYTFRDIINKAKKSNNPSRIWPIWILLALVAYIFDVFENISYLTEDFKNLKYIAKFKIFFFAVVIVIPLIYHLLFVSVGLVGKIKRFIRSSYISLLIIAVIGLFMVLLPQGATVMIDMFDSWWKVLVSVIFVNFLAAVVSHYPFYVEYNFNDNLKDVYELKISRDCCKWTGLGIITYYRNTNQAVEMPLKAWYLTLGILLLSMWTCALLYPLKSAFAPHMNLLEIYVIMVLGFNLYYAKKEKIKSRIKNIMGYESKFQGRYNSILRITNSFTKSYFHVVAIFLILGLAFIIVSIMTSEWSWKIQLFGVVLSIINIFVFVEFRLSRSFLKYVYPNEENKKSFIESPKRYLEDRVDKLDTYEPKSFKPKSFDVAFFDNALDQNVPFGGLKKIFLRLSDNTVYIKNFRFFGVLVLIYFCAANVFIEQVQFWTSAINIFLAFMILFYSIVVIWLKHYMYYNSDSKKRPQAEYDNILKWKFRFTKGIPLTFAIVFILSGYIRSLTNNIHTLDPIPKVKTESVFTLDQYTEQYLGSLDTINPQPISIAADGGGLKANLWTMLVLHQMYSDNKLKDTYVISGVSGGAMGIGNFYRLIECISAENRKNAIYDIGMSNILSIDVAGLLLRDFILSFTTIFNNNRSHYAMKSYASTLNADRRFAIETFTEVWKDIYDNDSLPLIMINSTAVGNKQGYALSIDHESDKIPASIDVVNIEQDATISYYNALSTSNRFPIASPAAKIKSKGYFLDGGYFENSGIQAAQHVIDLAGPVMDSLQHKIINIRNGKEDWVQEFVKDFKKKFPDIELRSEIQKTEEISAIVKTVINIDKNPLLIRESLEQDSKIAYILMPHLICLQDIADEISGEVQLSKELLLAIKQNNDQVRETLKNYTTQSRHPKLTYKLEDWGVVMPPLARVLSKPAVIYEMAMAEERFYTPEIDAESIRRIVD